MKDVNLSKIPPQHKKNIKIESLEMHPFCGGFASPYCKIGLGIAENLCQQLIEDKILINARLNWGPILY